MNMAKPDHLFGGFHFVSTKNCQLGEEEEDKIDGDVFLLKAS
jgi:hypothetical protein